MEDSFKKKYKNVDVFEVLWKLYSSGQFSEDNYKDILIEMNMEIDF